MRLLPTLLLIAFATPAVAAPFKTKAPYALLIDQSSGKTLFDKNGASGMAPASTTKILTAEVVFSRLAAGQMKLDDTFTVSPHAATEGDAEVRGIEHVPQGGRSRSASTSFCRGC